MRILLIEDNEQLAALISAGLAKEGFVVDTVRSAADGLAAFADAEFALVILDLGLPDSDGLSVIDHLRRRGVSTPVLVVTARFSVSDRVKGLERGADDYLGKPFAFEELVARIRALLRRPGEFVGDYLRLGNLVLDPASREITVSDRRHALPMRECSLLEALMRRPNSVLSKQSLEERLYGFSAAGSSNAIEVTVHRLRKQLSDAGAAVIVHTVRGVGYLIKEQD